MTVKMVRQPSQQLTSKALAHREHIYRLFPFNSPQNTNLFDDQFSGISCGPPPNPTKVFPPSEERKIDHNPILAL